eukprot:scaffold268748_cov18-Tisochrysis_lutea.AAC.2
MDMRRVGKGTSHVIAGMMLPRIWSSGDLELRHAEVLKFGDPDSKRPQELIAVFSILFANMTVGGLGNLIISV